MRCLPGLAAIVTVLTLPATHGQEQIVLAPTGSIDSIALSWVTMSASAASEKVAFGTSAAALNASATATSFVYDGSSQGGAAVTPMRIHNAILAGLLQNTVYYYSIGLNATVHSFRHNNVRVGGTRWAVFADLGLVNNVALATLLADAEGGVYDAVIHAGDFAYNLEDKNGQVGNDYMRAVSPISSTRRVSVCRGNHEYDGGSSAGYLSRFSLLATAAKASKSTGGPLWYSYDDGLVHWVFVDSELYCCGGSDAAAQIKAELAWMAADLGAVNRSKTPWVAVVGHKQTWMKSSADPEFYAVFDKFHVNFYFGGHEHNYQRLYPTVAGSPVTTCVKSGGALYEKCPGYITIIAGSPGCDQDIGTKNAGKAAMIQYEERYGFGYLQVANATHAHWTWKETAATSTATGELVAVDSAAAWTDDAWVVQAAV